MNRHSCPQGELPSIHGYQIIRKMGQGGMGIVYEAEEVALKRKVALKVIVAGRHAGDTELDRFRKEAQAVASLKHPNIIQIHKVWDDGDVPYLALEFVDGGSLATRLDRRPQAPDEAARIVRQLAAAMQHAHDKKLIHRDLKPANVLLTKSGEPKITDFGLAKRQDASLPTSTGHILGTPPYMPPEQARGEATLDHRADIYALGAILYEMLTGRPPFDALAGLDTLIQVLSRDPIPPTRLQPKVSRDLETICLKCLEKEPGKRYASAQALADDLGRFQAGEPITARPMSFVERRWRWCKRRPALAALFAVLVLGMPTFILVLLAWWHEASLSEVTKQAQEERLAAAEKIAATEKYHSLVNKVGESTVHQEPGWTWQGLRDLETAANLPLDARDKVKLRSLAVKCLAGVDLKEVGEVAKGINAFCLAYSPDGKRLAVAENYGATSEGGCKVEIYQAGDFKKLKEYRAANSVEEGTRVRSLAFSPDGRWLAAGTRSGEIHFWDTANDQHTVRKAHQDEVRSLAFKPDGKTLFSCSKDKFLKVWSTHDWRESSAFFFDYESQEVVCDPQGTMLGCATSNGYKVFEMRSVEAGETPFRIHRLLHEAISSGQKIAFSRDGNILAYCRSYDILLISTYLSTDDPHLPLKESFTGPQLSSSHEGDIQHLEFNADDSLLVSSAIDRTVKLWEVATGRLLAKLVVGGTGNVFAAFDPAGHHLAVTCEERTAIYEIGGLREQTLVAASASPIRAAAFSADGQTLASVGYGSSFERRDYGYRHELRLWRWKNGRYQAGDTHWWSERSRDDRVASVAFNPQDGAVVHSIDWTKPFRVWHGEKQASRPADRNPILYSLSFARDGKTLWGAGHDYEVVSLSWPDQSTIRTWANVDVNSERGNRGINVVCAGKSRVLAGSQDSSTKLLRIVDAKLERYWLSPGGPVTSVALNEDETLAVSGTQKGIVQIVRVPSGEPVQELMAHRDLVKTVAFSPDRKLLATGSRDKSVRLWQRSGETFRELVTLPSPGPVVQVCFHPDGNKLAMVVENEFGVRMWHLDRLQARFDHMGLGW